MIYINITSSFTTKRRTGIQRVVANLGEHFIDNFLYIFITYNYDDGKFYKLENVNNLADAIYNDNCELTPLVFSELNSSDYFFDIDAAWSDAVDRKVLYSKLREKKVGIINLHYDSVPIVNSAWSHANTVIRYMDFFYSKIAYSDFIFSISNFVKNEIDELSSKIMGVVKPGAVIPLGPLPVLELDATKNALFENKYRELLKKPYFISVGTIEPRKNYDYLVEVYNNYDLQDARLVLVGREGWNVDDFIKNLKTHANYINKNILWLSDVDDEELAFLYSKCLAYVTSSHYEGYGLPAVEALTFGIPTIVSNGGALPEVVGNAAEVFSLSEPESLYHIMNKLIRSEEYRGSLVKRAKSYKTPEWKDAFNIVNDSIQTLIDKKNRVVSDDLNQIVYISISPDKFALSIQSVIEKIKFIDSVIVLTTQNQKKLFVDILSESKLNYQVLCDEDLLSNSELMSSDHQTRNTMLRKELYKNPLINDNFLASDDDYIALKDIDKDFYIVGGKYVAYYYYNDMESWTGSFPQLTSYDAGIIKTGRMLRSFGYSTKGFSSHMPQVINKEIVNEVYDRYLSDSRFNGMDEWSVYFNIAIFDYPEKFISREYQTFNWPGNATDWVCDVIPDNYHFQNYYDNSENGLDGVLSKQIDILKNYHESLVKYKNLESGEGYSPIVILFNNDMIDFVNQSINVKAGRQSLRRIFLLNKTGATKAFERVTIKISPAESGVDEIYSVSFDKVNATWLPLNPPIKNGLYQLTCSFEFGGKVVDTSVQMRVGY